MGCGFSCGCGCCCFDQVVSVRPRQRRCSGGEGGGGGSSQSDQLAALPRRSCLWLRPCCIAGRRAAARKACLSRSGQIFLRAWFAMRFLLGDAAGSAVICANRAVPSIRQQRMMPSAESRSPRLESRRSEHIIVQITADGNLSMTCITARASCRRLRRHLRQLHGSDAMRALSERAAAATTMLLSLLSQRCFSACCVAAMLLGLVSQRCFSACCGDTFKEILTDVNHRGDQNNTADHAAHLVVTAMLLSLLCCGETVGVKTALKEQ